MNINRTIAFVIYVSLLPAQFKPGFVKEPKTEIGIKEEGFYEIKLKNLNTNKCCLCRFL